MDQEEMEWEAPLEVPFLCINNCGFFGSAATMNMCSKCHKDLVLKLEQAKLVESFTGSIVNESLSNNGKEASVAGSLNLQIDSEEPQIIPVQPSDAPCVEKSGETKANAKEGIF